MAVKKLSPSDKAAVILATLGEGIAPQLVAGLGHEEGKRIIRSLQSLRTLDLEAVEGVLEEFLQLLQSPKSKSLDVRAFTRSLQKGKGSERLAFIEALNVADGSMRVFERTSPDILFRVIANESPQTLALILCHAPSDFAAALIKLFPESLRIELLVRMARLQEVDPLVVAELDEQLLAEIDKLSSNTSHKAGGIKKAAEILNALNQDANILLEGISRVKPQLATDIRQEMFTFENLLSINDRGLTEIIKGFRRELLILALRGASEEMIQRFSHSMSERSARLFREDLDALGAQKKSDVMKARAELVQYARALIDSGKIGLNDTDGYV
jgi:flagellar motor switch protein FliG